MPILDSLTKIESARFDREVEFFERGQEGVKRNTHGNGRKNEWCIVKQKIIISQKKEVESSTYVSTRYIKSLNDFFFFVHPVYIHILTYIHALYNVCLAVLERIAIRRIGGVIFCS